MGAGSGRRQGVGTRDARERILSTAYQLFCRRGVKATGVDTIIEQSGVAKMSVYRHFRSKDELVLAVLDRRAELWSDNWLRAEVLKRGETPAEQMLAIFDTFDGWFRRRDFEGCFFLNALLEFEDRKHPVHKAARAHLVAIRRFVRELATAAGAADPEKLAHQWHILMKGSILAAGEGDREAALRAREVGALLLAHHLP